MESSTKHLSFLRPLSHRTLLQPVCSIFGLKDVDDTPRFNEIPHRIYKLQSSQQWDILSRALGRFVDRFIIVRRFSDIQPSVSVPRELTIPDIMQNPHSRRVMMEHTYSCSVPDTLTHDHCYTTPISRAIFLWNTA